MKIKLVSVLASLAAALLLSGCPSSGTSSQSPAQPVASKTVITGLAGQTWTLATWISPDGSAQDAGPIEITFGEENRISGFGGVNRYMGAIAFTDAGEIDLSKGLASTMMAGPQEAMTREHRYLQELAKVRRAHIDRERLILTGDGSLRFEFARKK